MPKKQKETSKKPRTPSQVIEDLAPAYLGWKSNEKDKNKYKDEFFEGITRHLGEGDLAEEIVTGVEAKDAEQALELVAKQYPTWTTEDVRKDPENEGFFEVIIKENPEYLPFTIEFDEKVWGRQIAAGSQMLDDERLADEDPDLWMEVTELPNEEFLLELIDDGEIGQAEAIEAIERIGEKYGIQRRVKSLNDLEPSILAELQKYVYESKPVVKLPAPKKAEADK